MKALSIVSVLVLSACAADNAGNASPPPAAPTATATSVPVAVAASLPAAATPSIDADKAATPPTAQKGTISGAVTTIPANAIKTGVVVYLEDGPKESGQGMAATIDNRQMMFTPAIAVITAGGTVKFENADPFPHNVFSPKPDAWDMGTIGPKGSKTRKFDKPGFYTLLCNLHPNMIAHLAVVPSTYFAKADASGKYAIKDVPPGTYKIGAWAPRLQLTTQPVTVNGDVTVNLEVKR